MASLSHSVRGVASAEGIPPHIGVLSGRGGRVRRRELLIAVGGSVVAWPIGLRAQRKAMPVIGFLNPASPGPAAPVLAAIRQGLSETGYVEGQTLAIEYRWAEGRYDLLPALAADLVGHKVDVIVTFASPGVQAARGATSTIPIVFLAVGDPVKDGQVASLARPGGNITAISLLGSELTPKRIELLSEMVPQAKVIGLLVNPNNPVTESLIRDAHEAAHAKGVQLAVLKAGAESEIDAAFATLVNAQAGMLVIGSDPLFLFGREQLVALTSLHAVPTIYFAREFAASGGLMSYGTSLAAVYRQVGLQTGKILNGAKPADLPVELPTKFELVINLKTANALGLTVPQSLLVRADEVIE